MRKLNNNILYPIILVFIFFIATYTVVYFKKNRDILNETQKAVIENNIIIQKNDSITTLKIDSISQKTNDSILINQNKIIKLLETPAPVVKPATKSKLITKIKNLFSKK